MAADTARILAKLDDMMTWPNTPPMTPLYRALLLGEVDAYTVADRTASLSNMPLASMFADLVGPTIITIEAGDGTPSVWPGFVNLRQWARHGVVIADPTVSAYQVALGLAAALGKVVLVQATDEAAEIWSAAFAPVPCAVFRAEGGR